MIVDSNYFNFNKISGLIMPVLGAAFTVAGIKSSAEENKNQLRLKPLDQDESYRLQSPYAYQFEGGKHLSTKPTIGINVASNYSL